MPRTVPIAISLALLGGCATVPRSGGGSAWLVGLWVEDRAACAGSDAAIRYSADGTYAFEDEAGRWSLDGDALETVQMRPARGVKGSLRVQRVNDGVMRATYPSGESHTFYRC